MCRKQTGGGAYYAGQFKDGVTIEKGESLTWYKGSEWGERGFCSICGSAVAWRLQQFPDKLGISIGALDDTSGLKLEAHIFTDSGRIHGENGQKRRQINMSDEIKNTPMDGAVWAADYEAKRDALEAAHAYNPMDEHSSCGVGLADRP